MDIAERQLRARRMRARALRILTRALLRRIARGWRGLGSLPPRVSGTHAGAH